MRHQVGVALLAQQDQVDAGPPAPQRRQVGRDDVAGQGRRRADAHCPAQAAGPRRDAGQAGRFLLHAAGLLGQRAALGRQAPAARQTVEQPHAERLLERVGAAGHGGVLHAQPARRGRQAAFPRQREKVADVIPLQGRRRFAARSAHRHRAPGLNRAFLHRSWLISMDSRVILNGIGLRYNVANPFPPHRKSKSVPISAWMFVVRTQRIWQREPGHFSGLRVAGTAVPLRYAAAAARAGPVPGRRAAFLGAAQAMGPAACGAGALARASGKTSGTPPCP
uniref:Uncharacterized protein n=1 Tax=Ralstonia solanacearum TaxID=305 RepID=A0A0S4WUH2_RALSL|nr:protein of unknown function [Ralstonia solanacearum]